MALQRQVNTAITRILFLFSYHQIVNEVAAAAFESWGFQCRVDLSSAGLARGGSLAKENCILLRCICMAFMEHMYSALCAAEPTSTW